MAKFRESGAMRPHDCSISLQGVVLDYPLGPVARGSIKSGLFSLFGGARDAARAPDTVRALNNISLSVGYGERLGIIGSNGSGKSTLLRAIAGIYPITSGSIEIHGRVQGIFDIGLGFEPESTGRENILYRGLTMGMSPSQIASREAEIVEFANIGTFIDLPIRTYSSGMAVRLAFAISTYLQGDVLLLDEMLGAGDAAFQAKASARMRSLVESAKILVLVSHDMNTIKTVCTRAIWVLGGRIVADGAPDDVVEVYLEKSAQV